MTEECINCSVIVIDKLHPPQKADIALTVYCGCRLLVWVDCICIQVAVGSCLKWRLVHNKEPQEC